MEITTPLGADVLLFHGMSAREELSRLFEYQLDLLSLKPDINVDDILGKNVTVRMALPDDNTRYFSGFVTRFSQGARYGRYTRYFAIVRPWLWFLTRTTDCRIFQEMTVPEIVKQVFADHPIADFKFELTGTYKKWTYCVQYRETDFNFVSRLLEQEGIYYYVRHTDGHDTMVLTDSTSKHEATPGYETLPFVSPEEVVRPELERISTWEYSREVQPGVYVHDDYDLERPSVELKTRKTLTRSYEPSDYEIYDYPGLYIQKPDGEQYAGVRIDEYGTQFEVAHASTNAKGINVGSLLTLQRFPRTDQNCEHLILSASHNLQFSDYEAMPPGRSGTEYHCSFAAMTSKQQFRPRRLTPKPFVQGPQTAVVVGPAAEEIHTDKYGRVKVQFHWDRYGKKDENSSCWIRVSHPWAGKGWGSVATPRIGQEVIVDFIEGDPDQPIITGRVYNAEAMPPYELPANSTQTGIMSRSSKGGGGFNEIRLEDKKDDEHLYIHAQRDMKTQVERDQAIAIGRDQSSVVKRDQSLAVTNNRSIHVRNNESHIVDVDQKLKVGANQTNEIVGNQSSKVDGVVTLNAKGAISTDTKSNRIENTTGTESRTIGGNLMVKVAGNLGYKAANMVFEAGHIEHKITGSSSHVHEVPNGPYTIMANKFSVLSNTDASIMAVGKINYTSIESNTTVMGPNSNGYVGHSSTTAMGLSRNTFLGLAINTFVGVQISTTLAVMLETVAGMKLSVSAGPHIEMHPMKIYSPGGGGGGGGAALSFEAARVATALLAISTFASFVSGVAGGQEVSDQYAAARQELREAADEADAAGHPGLATRLRRLSQASSTEAGQATALQAGTPPTSTLDAGAPPSPPAPLGSGGGSGTPPATGAGGGGTGTPPATGAGGGSGTPPATGAGGGGGGTPPATSAGGGGGTPPASGAGGGAGSMDAGVPPDASTSPADSGGGPTDAGVPPVAGVGDDSDE
jgi:type VI secretion system secreted protein VgrG